jgi:hypothetical protein
MATIGVELLKNEHARYRGARMPVARKWDDLSRKAVAVAVAVAVNDPVHWGRTFAATLTLTLATPGPK